MAKQWSGSTRKNTCTALEELSFYARNGKVFFKHINGDFGYMDDSDVLDGRYAIHSPSGEKLTVFHSITDFLNHGWVLD